MTITFGIVEHQEDYYQVYDQLLRHIKMHFSDVEFGMQGDAYIWIKRNGQKVAVDTFGAMQFEIKSTRENELSNEVIEVIQKKYPVRLYDPPFDNLDDSSELF